MSKKLRIIILVVAFVVFCVSAYNLALSYYQEYTANSGLDSIRQEVIIEAPAPDKTAPDETAPDEADAFSTLSINFDLLFKINPDIVAWLYIPGTPVSYPLLHGTDNRFYLTRTFDKKYNELGSIFLAYRNSPHFESLNTVIYGHNTRNDSMFGSLKRFKDQAYADQKRYVHIIRSGEVRVYEIFSIYETAATSDTYTIHFASEEAFAEYVKKMASRTIVHSGSPLDTESMITLSTCTPHDRAARLVIQAKLVDFQF